MTDPRTAEDIRALMARAEGGDAPSQLRMAQLFRQAGDADRARSWLDKAVAQGFAPAFGERGLARLGRLDITGALGDLETAAAVHDGAALLALAGLAATGSAPSLGGWSAAMRLLSDAARHGNKAAWRDMALLAEMAGAQPQSDVLLAHAAASGDGIALYSVLCRADQGRVTLEPSVARAYRSALKRVGFPLAPPAGDSADDVFPPFPNAPVVDWDALLATLRNPPGLGQPALQRLSRAPDVWINPGFLTAEECDTVVAGMASSLAPSRVIDPLTGIARQDPIRTNLAASEATAWMSPAKAAMALRLAAAAGADISCAEPASLLCYRPGEEYRPHFDWLGAGPMFDLGGQRMKTALVYLNEGYAGGETRFLTPGLDVPAAKGTAVFFTNANSNGEPDMTSRHAGMPVTRGVKLVWSQWYRAYAMPL